MSGSRLARKVTVEGTKNTTDTSAPRKSVFDRLGPGAIERSHTRREESNESAMEKSRSWVKDGRSTFGSKTHYDHASASSKMKLIRSIVSKNEDSAASGDRKGLVRLKRSHSPEEIDNSARNQMKRKKVESIKVTKDSLHEELKESRETRRQKDETKASNNPKQHQAIRGSISSSGWNLQDDSDSDEDSHGKQLDWEERGELNQAREVALEERRKDLRRQIATIDERDEPVVTISNIPLISHPSPQFHGEETKAERKKKSRSDKSKKKMKKKSHRNAESVDGNIEQAEKSKKAKKKKKHSADSDQEIISTETSFRKDVEDEVFHHEYIARKRHENYAPPPVDRGQTDQQVYRYDKQARTSGGQQYERDAHARRMYHERGMTRDARTLEQSKHQKYEEREQNVKESRQFDRMYHPEKAPHGAWKESRAHGEKESKQMMSERETRQLDKISRQTQYERDSRQASFNAKRQPWSSQYESGGFEKDHRKSHLEKESRLSHHERAARTPSPSTRSPSFGKSSRSHEWESQYHGRSPVMDKRHRQYQHETSRIGEQIPLSHDVIHARKEHSSGKVSQSYNKDGKIRKKRTPQSSHSFEKSQIMEETEIRKEHKKPGAKGTSTPHNEERDKRKKGGRQEESVGTVRQTSVEKAKSQKVKPGATEVKKKGPRTPSPQFAQLPLSFEKEPIKSENRSSLTKINKRSRPEPSQSSTEKNVMSSKNEKNPPVPAANESITESSDSSSSSDESGSEDEPNVSGNSPIASDENTQRKLAKEEETRKKTSKVKRKQHKTAVVARDTAEHLTEGVKQHVSGEKERHVTDTRKERKDDERYYRATNIQDHRRTRDEDSERRVDARATKDMRDMRDNRESRDYRDFPRIDFRDHRERERFRGDFDERERLHPFDTRRDYRDSPSDFGGSWSRDMRGRDGYDGYDGRDYDERRGDGRGIPHTDRGRFREMEDRHEGNWHDRRGYRESETYHEGRDRYQEDTKATSKVKRSRPSPQPSRPERKGRQKDHKRGPGVNANDSEEWDYEEGQSPGQQSSSRKRGRDSQDVSPRSDTVKRKKGEASSPERKISDNSAGQEKEVDEMDGSKDNKNTKKDKEKSKKIKKTKTEEERYKSEKISSPERKRSRETSRENEERKAKSEGTVEVGKKTSCDIDDCGNDQTLPSADDPKGTEMISSVKKSVEQMNDDCNKSGAGITLAETDDIGKSDRKDEKPNDSSVEKAENETVDVYDLISDDELIENEEQYDKEKEKAPALDIVEVDWSVLATSTEQVSAPGDYIKRFSAGNIFSRTGLSSALVTPALSEAVREKCAKDVPDGVMKDLLNASGQKKLQIGALIAAEGRKMKERENVVSDIGPCRRALCARRDFHIRKKLRKLATTKLGTKLLLDNTAIAPVDSELFALSVSIFKRRTIDAKEESYHTTETPEITVY